MKKLYGIAAVASLFAAVVLSPSVQASGFNKTPEAIFKSFPDQPNLSLHKSLSIYAFDIGSLTAVQINDRDGRILGAYLVTDQHIEVLPFGERPDLLGGIAGQSIAEDGSYTPMQMGECPCSSSRLYEDGEIVIVGIFDMNGNLIRMYAYRRNIRPN